MQPIQLHPILFYFFIVMLFFVFTYAVMISWFYFSKWFKDVVLFIDAQNRWNLMYFKSRDADEIEYLGGSYVTKGISPPLSKGGKALYMFSVGNPKPIQVLHKDAEQISSQTISSIINNKLVQVLMSLQSSFMNLQYIMLGASVVSAICSVFIILKVYGVIK